VSAATTEVTNWLIGVSGAVTSSAIIYAARSLRRFSREHRWLMEKTEQHGLAIEQHAVAIEQQGEAIEKLLHPPRARSR